MTRLRAGEIVRIVGATYSSMGRVIDSRPPEQLPDLRLLIDADQTPPDVWSARGILAEWRVMEVATIEYAMSGKTFAFIALRGSNQRWRDLQGQELTIQPVRRPWSPPPPGPRAA